MTPRERFEAARDISDRAAQASLEGGVWPAVDEILAGILHVMVVLGEQEFGGSG